MMSGKERESTVVSRRRMLGGTLAGLASFTIVPRHVLGGVEPAPPSERPALAGVGIGGVGFGQLQGAEEAGFKIVALCDVDDAMGKKAYDKWPQARRYRDFREMLEAEGDRIDAVYIGTPDHSHAVITMAALRRKKHVCCVKPLTRTIRECRTVVAAAREAGVATQVTAQPHTSESGCRTCELIQAGAIGAVREVHVWTDRPLWPQGMMRPEESDSVPSTLDWNLWLGPAPMRPFKNRWPEGHLALRQIQSRPDFTQGLRAVYHPFNFRGWWDFGTGALGDMGCHYFNTVFRALKLEHPIRVEATATAVFDETPPLASIVTADFPAREGMPPLRLVWYDGGIRPPAPRELEGRPLSDNGTLYIGDEGKMLGSRILPAARAEKAESIARTLPRRSGPWGEWFEASTGGQPAGCNFEWAGPLTEIVLLGNMAIRAGRALEWDGAQGRVTNVAEANRYLEAPYRDGWSL